MVVRSDGPDRGSECTVRLPLTTRTPKRPVDREKQRQNSAQRRILVADDNKDAAQALSEILNALGNDARAAYDGLQALEMASSFRPEVVVLDIGMPRLNGHDTARRMRAQPWGRDIVLIALTGWGQEEDKRLSREAGFDHHLVKPIELASLEKLLATPV